MRALRLCSLASIVALTVLVLAASAEAVPINRAFVGEAFLDTDLPGTTAAARPELAGVVLVDENQPFAFGELTGRVLSRVVRQNVAGTLDFYWRIFVDEDATGRITGLRLGSFGYDHLVDADWRSDGIGNPSPTIARLFNPASAPEGNLSFLFGAGAVTPTDPISHSMFLSTSAVAYARTAFYDLCSGATCFAESPFSTYAPAADVPEPSTIALVASGLLGWLSRRGRGLRRRDPPMICGRPRRFQRA